MRILLATAVAIAPLMAAAGAQAEIVISTARTTPIQTSNATGTAADNIRIASGGSVAVGTGAAVTLNSNNSIDIDSGGSITIANAADGATGIQVNGGNTGTVTVGGAINITDTLTEPKDADEDGDLDGPFAVGTGRYGVRVSGAAPFPGDINTETSGSIRVEGNNSFGIGVETDVVGSIQSLGTIGVLGDNSTGIRVAGDVSGDVEVLGSVTANGAGSQGLAVEGDVGGVLKLQGAIAATGYRYTTPPPTRPETGDYADSIVFLDELDADDLLQGGPAVSVAGNIADGILLDTGPTYANGVDGDDDGDGVKNGDEDDDGDGKKNSEDTDRDGDGILDTAESTASITSLGGAAALQIGSATQAVDIGVVDDESFGLINRGSVTANGLYSGVASEALVIGVPGGQTTTIQGGLSNAGSITSSALDANSTGVRLGAGASTPTMSNTGTIQTTLTSDEASTATALQIDAGANLPSLTNSGVILAGAAGNLVDATAIRDASGTLASLTNTGRITAVVQSDTEDDTPVDSTAVAVDVSANTTGVNFVQNGVVNIDEDDTTTVDTDGDGVSDATEPAVQGNILFGSGADTLDVRNGTVVGDISFGTGADRLSITGGATVSGAITDADGLLDINVADGTLVAGQSTSTTISNLDIGADGTLLVSLDPANDTTPGFNVTGTANLAEGAGLGVRFTSLLEGPERFTIIEAGTLNAGTIDQTLVEANSPYLYVVNAAADEAAGEVYVDARRRTAEEAGLISVEASAYDAVYGALGDNEALRNLFLSQSSREGFIDAYEQMLPDHSGGPLMSLSAGVDAVTRALTGRNAAAAPGETSAWLQEINFYADKDKTDTYGFRSEGFGVAGGVEKGSSLGAFGISAAFTSSDIKDPEAEAEEVLSANLLELGLYWRAQGQYWTTWARAAGGYASFNADRSLVADGVYLNNTSDWHGWTAAVAGGASYERNFGRLNVRPEIYGEYFHLSEGARTEQGGGDGFDLDIDSRDSHIFSAVAAMNIGYGFGRNQWLRPELRIGYRQNISVDAGETIARFASGGPDFILSPDAIEGGGPILGFRVNFGNDLGMISLTGDAELLEDYVRYSLLLRASFRF